MILRRAHLILLMFLLGVLQAGATHIIGGVINYEHLGNNDYLITMKIYRDCGPANTNQTGFDSNVELTLYDQNGALVQTLFMTGPAVTPVPVIQTNPCLTPPLLCVEEGVYTANATIIVPTGGLTMAYQRCCRNPTILNVVQQQGLTVTGFMPDGNQFPGNSSPEFVEFPPIAICANDDLLFDHSAIDPDGDSLVYSLCAPFAGASPANPAPGSAPAPPYSNVVWNPGFSGAAPLNGTISIDPVTGVLSAFPTVQGQYVVGVCVEEFRNGVSLGVVKRDFQFNVTACTVNTLAAIGSQQTLCDGVTVNFINQSVSATSYHWDFGVNTLTNDTSDLFEPTFIYPDTGNYTITLVANPGWPCADTTLMSVQLNYPITATINVTDTACLGDLPLTVEAVGTFSPSANVIWDLGPNAANQFQTGPVASASWPTTGVYNVGVTVSEFGCSAVASDSVIVQSSPVAAFTWGPQGCEPYTSIITDLSTSQTPLTYAWDFGDGTVITDSVPPYHVYDSSGSYDISLTVWSSSGCIDTSQMTVPNAVNVLPIPTAGFLMSDTLVNVLDPTFTATDTSTNAVAWQYQVNDVIYGTQNITHTLSGGGYFDVLQIVTNSFGCVDTARATIGVIDYLLYVPNAFTPNGDGINDEWKPSAEGALEYQLLVFNRWGDLIFETEDEFQAWNGENAPIGMYLYRLRIKALRGYPKEYIGHFSLIR